MEIHFTVPFITDRDTDYTDYDILYRIGNYTTMKRTIVYPLVHTLTVL